MENVFLYLLNLELDSLIPQYIRVGPASLSEVHDAASAPDCIRTAIVLKPTADFMRPTRCKVAYMPAPGHGLYVDGYVYACDASLRKGEAK